MTKELSTKINAETLEVLRNSYPVEKGANRIMLPRLTMASQDVTEGKGKAMKVVAEAGTFYIERPTDEEDENGKKIWEKKELGSEIEGVILYQRKQLRMFNETTEEYTSSPVFDNEDEIVPLFCNRSEVGRGTPAELKEKYQYTDKEGKVKSKLEENRILYVQYKGDYYQMNLRGSSMYSFLSYARKVIPPAVVTVFGSEPKEKGTIAWNQMTFEVKRNVTQAEAEEIVKKVDEIKSAIIAEKSQYLNQNAEVVKVKEEFDKF